MTTLVDKFENLLQLMIDAETKDCWKCLGSGLPSEPRPDPCVLCNGVGILVPSATDPRIATPMFVAVIPHALQMQREGSHAECGGHRPNPGRRST